MALDETQQPEQPSTMAPRARRHQVGTSQGALTIVVFWLAVMGALYWAMTQYLKPKPFAMTAAGDLVIPRHRDGHFYVDGTVNGQRVNFLVDTGASTVVVSEAFARSAGMAQGVPTTFSTANGRLQGRMVQDVAVNVGPIQATGVRVGVGLEGAPDGEALLGQSLLSKFDVTVNKEQMTLHPR